MNRIERSVVIERPIDDVFAFVHNPLNDSSWQTTLIESTQVDDEPFGIGTHVRERRRFLGVTVEMTKEITAYEPPTGSAFKMVAGGAPMSGEYRLEPLEGKTRLTATGWVEARGFFRVAESLFASMAGRELEASLGHLKELLEADSHRLVLSDPVVDHEGSDQKV